MGHHRGGTRFLHRCRLILVGLAATRVVRVGTQIIANAENVLGATAATELPPPPPPLSPSPSSSSSTPTRLNPVCVRGACIVCPVGAVCVSTAEDPSRYRDCIRTTMNQVGWVKGTCSMCECRSLTQQQRNVLRPQFFTREKMWYHLHISKTGGINCPSSFALLWFQVIVDEWGNLVVLKAPKDHSSPAELNTTHTHTHLNAGTTFENLLRKRLAPMSGLRMCDEALQTTFQTPFKYKAASGDADLFAPKDDLMNAKCQIVSAEGRRQLIPEQFHSTPEILTFLREPTLRTVSQWNHDRQYNQLWEGRSLTPKALEVNGTRDQVLLRDIPSSLNELYADEGRLAALHERYGNWMFYRLCANIYPTPAFSTHSTFQEVKTALRTFAFLGLSDHYRTSLCLLAFQFHLAIEFSLCHTRPLNVYNSACYHNGTTNKDCGKGQSFSNKFDVKAKELAKDHRRAIPPGLEATIYNHTWLDKKLYTEATRIFWARVLVMESVTGRSFQVPDEYRSSKPSARNVVRK
eukprot:m.155734 g.155734  ORF g.155734 m.155734 type:complete len:520 (+) comp23582_c0_seq2:364-1923(+)